MNDNDDDDDDDGGDDDDDDDDDDDGHDDDDDVDNINNDNVIYLFPSFQLTLVIWSRSCTKNCSILSAFKYTAEVSRVLRHDVSPVMIVGRHSGFLAR